jgi:phosphatidate cytidylyltransferase
MLYLMSVLYFVFTVRIDCIHLQVRRFILAYVAAFVAVGPGCCANKMILNGMIWLLLPISLVVTNDSFTYICGRLVGRTQLSKLSPKKTVESFLGAWLCTVLLGFAIASILQQYTYFTCRASKLQATILTGLSCKSSHVFSEQEYTLDLPPSAPFTIAVKPIYVHTFVLAMFASLLSPFGGLLASAVKRALKIKDFGSIIPGHGGVIDRIDCQLVMVSLAYMYYNAFVFTPSRNDMASHEAGIAALEEQFRKLVSNGASSAEILRRLSD